METKEMILNKIYNLIDISYLNKIILSNPIKKSDNFPKKINIKRVLIKDTLNFQISYFIDQKVVHENIANEGIILNKIIDLMEYNFKQCEVFANNYFIILMNNKSQFKITGIKKSTDIDILMENHNRVKNYILKNGEFIEWLYKLNVIDKNGSVLNHMQKKFRQINKFLEIIKDIENYIPNNGKIIDMGCGKSYLTFAIYHYLNNMKNKNIVINGYDLKKDVVENCNKLAKEFEFKNLKFFNEDIKNLNIEENINMLISLHACNTATDYAIYFGVRLNCDVILSVPCCQHEVFTQIKNNQLDSMLGYGILKERFSALLTDNLRADALKLCGYRTNIIEFIDMEHTPKNIMIKAIRNKNFKKKRKQVEQFKNLINNFSLNPTVYDLLKDYIN